MSLKMLLYLFLVGLVSAEENNQLKHDTLVAYSSVYTSFGSIKEEITPSDDPKQNSQNVQDKTASVYELIMNNGDNQQTMKDDSNSGEKKTTVQPIMQAQIIYSLPIGQAMSSIHTENNSPVNALTVPLKPILAPISAPAEIKVGSSPPLSSAIIGEGRLITPGLSAYASSAEEKAEPAEALISESSKKPDSQSESDAESHTSFDGFGANYSW